MQFDGSLHATAECKKNKSAMWSSSRLGDKATAASMASKLMQSVDAEIRNCALQADHTDWETLLTACDEATAEFVQRAKPAAASLMRLRALLRLDSVIVTARGSAYPFVFGTKKTNGLVSAVRFALDNAAVALYVEGCGRRTCLGVVARYGLVADLLHILDDLDSVVLEKDCCVRHEIHLRILGRAKAACVQRSLLEDCERLVRLSYYETFVVGAHLSAPLAAALHETCRSGIAISRVSKLVMKKIELDVLKVVDAHEVARHGVVETEENQNVIDRMHAAMHRLNCCETLEFK